MFQKISYRTKYLLDTIRLYKNPESLLSIFFNQNKKTKTRLELKKGVRFAVRKHKWDALVINELFVKKEYSVLERDFENPKTIIDVGAHIGAFSVYFANKFKTATIFCFEPSPDNFDLLKENVLLNCLQERVVFSNKAVVGKKASEPLQLFVCKDNPACNSLDKNYALPNSKSVQVQGIPLKEVFQKNNLKELDILKLDCENLELEILQNSKQELKKTKAVILEYHDPKRLSEIKVFLEGLGFVLELVPNSILIYGRRK